MSLMRVIHHPPCGAGTEGGNPELARESRRAQLRMDRNTNPCVNRRYANRAYARYQARPKGNRIESVAAAIDATGTLARFRRIVGSFPQRQTRIGNGITPAWLSGQAEQAVSRKPCRGGIAPEANASGKAGG